MKVPQANTTKMDPGKTFLNDQQNIEHHWIHLKTFPYDKNIQSLISAIIITMRCETEQDSMSMSIGECNKDSCACTVVLTIRSQNKRARTPLTS